MKFEPGTKVGPYQILGELGRGGMATVYRAYQPSLEREVALKILPESLVEQPGFKARFHREAVAVARLQHPNILSVFDHGEQDGVTYIVSEYVEGGTLASRMGAPIQLEYCVRILRPIADALDYAHSEGVIHRDVKPSNILMDRRGVPILSDFGLARVAEAAADSERLTQTGAMVGTPTYMAPEQCSGQEAGAPADIYALAVIAFEMVTGRVPFSAPTPLGVIAAHQVTPPPSPRKFNPSLPQVIEQPLLAGLAKNPANRPETATDFVEGLAAAITSAPGLYPMTPSPLTQLPPTPTGTYSETPAPSYAAPPPQPTPAPPSAPPYVPPAAPSSPPYVAPAAASPPPYVPAAASSPPYVSSPFPPPYYAPSATPPPSYPAMQQPAYAPASPYSGSQQWRPARVGTPFWVILTLWAGVALGVLGLIFAIVYALFVADMSDSDRWIWLLVGVLSVIAFASSLAALLGLGARDRWGPMMGWASVATLALTIIGSPLAAGVGWGLAQASKGQLVAEQPRPGGAMRLGGAATAGVLLLLTMSIATAWGWTHPFTSGTPVSNTTPTQCTILQADTPMTPSAVGSDCGFHVTSTLVQTDCRTITALPSTLIAGSLDADKGVDGGGGTFKPDSAGCHLVAPTYHIEEYLISSATLAPGDTLMVADFGLPSIGGNFGFLYACDSPGCIEGSFHLSDNTINVFDDATPLISQVVTPNVGTNRLMMAVQGKQVKVWINGHLVATETAARSHLAGKYYMFMESESKTASVEVIALQYAVYRIAA
jgi:serine/threonine protein kinase